MANNAGANLRVRISADLADIKQGLGFLRGELAKVKDSAERAQPNLAGWTNGLRTVRREAGALVATFASLAGTRMLAGVADEATQLRGRIRAAKGDYQAILAIGQETRTGLVATTDLYARLERGSRSLGLNQQRLLGLTRSVNQAIRLSFTSVAAGEAAVMQFGQALASGELRGDELNSVLEQTPRLAEAVAAGMGLQVGQLKALAKEGKLSAKDVIAAVESQAVALEKEFTAMPVTIGDALTQIRNSFVDYIGTQDEATGASREFALALQQIAKDLPRYLDPLLAIVTQLAKHFDVLAVAVGTYFGIQAVAAAVAGIQSLIAGFVALRATLLATEATAKGLRVVLATMGGPITLAIAALTAGIYYLYQRTSQAKQAAEEHTKALEANKNMAAQSRAAAMEDAQAKREQARRTLEAAQAALAEQRIRLEASRSRFARGGDRGDGAALAAATGFERAQSRADAAQQQFKEWGDRLVDLALQVSNDTLQGAGTAATATVQVTDKAIAQSNALLRDSIARALQELERLYDANEIGVEEYFAKRQALQEKSIDAQIAQAQMELAVTKELEQRRKLEEQIATLQRDRAEVGVAAAREQALAEEELTKQLGEVKIRLLELDGDTAAAERARLESEYQALFKRLEANSDEAGKAMVRNLIDRQVDQAALERLRSRAGEITGALQGREGAISAQVDAGLLGYGEGERQLQQVRATSLEQLRQLRDDTLAYLSTMDPSSPEAKKAQELLDSLDTDIANVAASQQKFRQQVEDQARSSLGNFFTDLVDGAKSFKDAFKDMVRSFVAGIAQMIAQELALQAVQAAGRFFGGGQTVSVAQHHGGGIAGVGGGVRRNVSPLLFGHAPRLHGGGIAGLAPNEVPTILERGEHVRTEEQEAALQRQLAAGSGGGSVVTTPVVVFSEDELANALAGHAGEKVVITHVRNNRGALGG